MHADNAINCHAWCHEKLRTARGFDTRCRRSSPGQREQDALPPTCGPRSSPRGGPRTCERCVPEAHSLPTCGSPCLQAKVATDNPGTCPQTTGRRCRTRTSGLPKRDAPIFISGAMSAPVLSAAPRLPYASRSVIFAAKWFLTRSSAAIFDTFGRPRHPFARYFFCEGSGFFCVGFLASRTACGLEQNTVIYAVCGFACACEL